MDSFRSLATGVLVLALAVHTTQASPLAQAGSSNGDGNDQGANDQGGKGGSPGGPPSRPSPPNPPGPPAPAAAASRTTTTTTTTTAAPAHTPAISSTATTTYVAPAQATSSNSGFLDGGVLFTLGIGQDTSQPVIVSSSSSFFSSTAASSAQGLQASQDFTQSESSFDTSQPVTSGGGSTTAAAFRPYDTSTSTAMLSESSFAPPDSADNPGSNRVLVIVLTTVLVSVGLAAIVGAVILFRRYRERRRGLLGRGLTPINDEEIESWRLARNEKGGPGGTNAGIYTTPNNHNRNISSSSSTKPPSVIVYSDPPPGRRSNDVPPSPFGATLSPRFAAYSARSSLDRDGPYSPPFARAPNAREGLTDDTVPGADPFIKRQPSRLSKPPITSPRSAHMRPRSGRSSFSYRTTANTWTPGGAAASRAGGSRDLDLELSPRLSHDINTHRSAYSVSTMAPRLSLGEDFMLGGLSPRPLFPDELIGRAVG